jgi:hypothetical protein
MAAPSDEPIRLTESQTELLTKALAEAARQAALPRLSETEIIKHPTAERTLPAAKPSKKGTVI